MGLAKPLNHICGHYKDQHKANPNYQRLSMLRDIYNFPVSQSKLEATLFGVTFSSEPTVPDINTLQGTR